MGTPRRPSAIRAASSASTFAPGPTAVLSCPGARALTLEFGHRRDLDLDGPGERSPCGDEAFPAEFKMDAVALYRSRPGATIKSVAADLGVNTETLRN
ncbi:transposase [Streptomyces sp. NBC_00212]|uniref:transposase n=1 Tax=Streptomyces sp. NBC_00212 TaxID=2975684 RepID=UPI0038702137